jgi:dTDP-4-amino-4,6-dideoxygalactose transaminase
MANRKNDIDDLAFFGGPALFAEQLHVGRPNIGDRERFFERMNDLFDRRWLTNRGPFVQQFEQRVAELTGVRHCVATSNATIGLEILIRALDLRGEIIVPSLTFIATPHVVKWLGLTPVFCDVDPITLTLDPERVEELVNPTTSAILGVHLWGRACDVQRLGDIANRHNLALLFDAAHALGCSSSGRKIGGFGNAEVFSFHATKVCNSFEGGAITTNDDELAKRLLLMHNFGFHGYDSVVELGINGKMSEAAAAMGLTSLESMDSFIAANRRNYDTYRSRLSEIPGVRLLEYDNPDKHNLQYIVIELDPARCGLSRDELAVLCQAENILARRYFYPGCHRMEPYRSDAARRRGPLPVTERAVEQLLTLPTGTAIGPRELTDVCDFLSFVFGHAESIGPNMRGSGFAADKLPYDGLDEVRLTA